MKKSVPSSPSKDGTQHLMRKTPSTRSLQSLQPIQPLSQLHQSPNYNNNDNNYKNNNNTNNGTFSNPISTRPSLRLNSPQTSQASFTPHHYQHAQSTQHSHTFHYEPDRERSTTLSSLDIPFHSVEREHKERSKSKVSNHDDAASGTTSISAGPGPGPGAVAATNTGIGHSTTSNNNSSAERAERAANRTYSAPQQPSRPKISRNRSATLPAFTHFEPIRMNDTMHTLAVTDDDDQYQHLHLHLHLHMHPQTHQPLHSPKIRSHSSLKALAFNHPESPTWLLSDLISNLSSLKDRDERYIVQISNDLVHLFQTYPKLEDEVQIRTVLPRILFMLYHPVSEVRSSCYRILRHLIVSYESLIILLQLKILIFIIVSMSNDQSGQTLIEMEQALKLVRKFLTINKGADLLSVGVVKALIAIVQCNDPDDHKGSTITSNYAVRVDTIPEGFKNACLETICEIALVKPELVFHGGGFKLIIDSVIDSSFEVSSTCLLIVLRLLNFQNSRKFLRNGFDLDSLIAIFSTDESLDTKKSSHFSAKIRKASTFKLQKVSFLISGLLKDFNGLMAFSINNFTSINNLLLNLNKSNYRVQNSILDIILDALRIQVFPWLQSGPIGDFVSRFNDLKQLRRHYKREDKYQQQLQLQLQLQHYHQHQHPQVLLHHKSWTPKSVKKSHAQTPLRNSIRATAVATPQTNSTMKKFWNSPSYLDDLYFSPSLNIQLQYSHQTMLHPLSNSLGSSINTSANAGAQPYQPNNHHNSYLQHSRTSSSTGASSHSKLSNITGTNLASYDDDELVMRNLNHPQLSIHLSPILKRAFLSVDDEGDNKDAEDVENGNVVGSRNKNLIQDLRNLQ